MVGSTSNPIDSHEERDGFVAADGEDEVEQLLFVEFSSECGPRGITDDAVVDEFVDCTDRSCIEWGKERRVWPVCQARHLFIGEASVATVEEVLGPDVRGLPFHGDAQHDDGTHANGKRGAVQHVAVEREEHLRQRGVMGERTDRGETLRTVGTRGRRHGVPLRSTKRHGRGDHVAWPFVRWQRWDATGRVCGRVRR